MNYNISDFLNRSYILNQTAQNKFKQTQILLQFISTALKQSLAIYEMQWKSSQNDKNSTNIQSQTINQKSQQKSNNLKEAQEKPLNENQQKIKNLESKNNSKSNQTKHQPNQIIANKSIIPVQNSILDEHKEIRTTCEYPLNKRVKIIHQNLHKQHGLHPKIISAQNLNFIDLYQPAYIPKDHFTSKQIRQKREKLLERKVQNWKQLDKKVGFRKMQLKKLLT